MTGKVSIVGAGPGAADLLTVRAASVLRRADVILHDDLVPREILDLASPQAQLIGVGKRCGSHSITQEQINDLMISFAGEGKWVVRLKSGDPSVFGRLGEELEALRNAKVPFEIVPGITASVAAASAASLTLTDRRAASTLVLMTAHHTQGKSLSRTLLNPQQTTYAIYMPGPDYSATVEELLELGLSGTTPCALVSNACRREQQVRFLSLFELQFTSRVAAPAVLIVGEVVRPGIFEQSTEILDKISESISNMAPLPTYQ
ncbi:MAG TPA: uroporphyrinogen-III C-methyltransferase [Candidatus Angelobacter sp.]|jgi:uroporphyrin-III C-methyltransferase|nr:uroporphyrinogen-III C-methyltransferase [Candidatus Angelobacter sp.]